MQIFFFFPRSRQMNWTFHFTFRLQIQALGYVNSTKVIFGDISRTEVCFPRRPHQG